jgi:peptide/nickel transport system substrate-binding protein
MKKKYIILGILGIALIFGGFLLLNHPSRLEKSGPKENSASISYAIPNDIVSFDNTSLVEELGTNLLLGHVYETLVQYDSNKKSFQPNLAERWNVSEDGIIYDFRLRENIKFHDSTDLNANVVVENITRIKDPKISPVLSQFLSIVKEVKTVDSRTVRFVLDTPSSSFIPKISFIGMASSAAIANGSLSEKPIGTGPLVFSYREPGKKIVFQRNDRYWGNKPTFKELDVLVIPDENARFIALRNNGLDFLPINQIGPENQSEILKNSDFSLTQVPANSLDSIYLNEKDALLSNNKMRVALTKAIDPRSIITILDNSVIEARGPIPVSYAENSQSLKINTYDLGQAKQLISEINSENKTIELMYLSDNPSYQKIAEYVAEQWGKIGVQTNLKKADTATMINNVITGKYQTAIIYLGGPYPDPLFFLEYVFASSGPYAKFLGYQNDKFEELAKKLQDEKDDRERKREFVEAQQIIIDDAPAIFLYNSTFGYIYNNKKIHGFKTDPFLPSKYFENIGLQ